MANSTIPNLVAVTVPALTDLLGVRQSGDTRDKKLTVTQLLSLGGVTDPLLLNAGAVGAPTYSFSGDPDTGVFNSAADQLALTAGGKEIAQCKEVAGAEQFIVSPGFVENNPALPALAFGNADTGFFESVDNTLKVSVGGVANFQWSGSIFRAENSAGPAMQNESASATNPTLIPSVIDQDTGIGSNAADQLSLVVGGAEGARVTEVAGANQFAIAVSGNSTVPDLTSLSDPDTGFRWTGSNEIIAVHANVRSWHFLQGSFFADASDGPILFNTFGSATVPSICVERGDPNTGIGKGTNDAISLICGGVEGLRLTERDLGVLQAPDASVGITAFATGGQTNATPITQTNNVIATVASLNDSVRLPSIFIVNTVVYIKNDGANAADVFPASGDDLGAGTDTAVSLAAGSSASFIATVANLTWTPFIVSVGGGGGDVTKVGTPVNNQVGVWTGDGTLEGVATFTYDGSVVQVTGGSAVGFQTDVATGPKIINEPASNTNPTLIPNRGDLDTGIGHAPGINNLSLIAGGTEGLRLAENNSGVIQIPNADIAITAFAGGGQGTLVLQSSYNVLSVVATTGDSVTLPGVFAVNSLFYIKNDGVNAADIFPNGGDDLGAGTNTAVSLAAGESISFIGVVASLTWTPWIVSVGGGGGDVTKVGTPVDNQVGVWTGDGTIEGDTGLTWSLGILTATRVRTGDGSAASPAHSFSGDPDSGLYSVVPGIVAMSVDGIDRFRFVGNQLRGATGGSFSLQNEVSSGTNPTLLPSQADLDTGIGRTGTDHLDLIAGGLSCISVRETASAREIGFYNTTPAPQSAAYSRAATIVESRALLASASATTLNNNNVLAALIADLQATGLLG